MCPPAAARAHRSATRAKRDACQKVDCCKAKTEVMNQEVPSDAHRHTLGRERITTLTQSCRRRPLTRDHSNEFMFR